METNRLGWLDRQVSGGSFRAVERKEPLLHAGRFEQCVGGPYQPVDGHGVLIRPVRREIDIHVVRAKWCRCGSGDEAQSIDVEPQTFQLRDLGREVFDQFTRRPSLPAVVEEKSRRQESSPAEVSCKKIDHGVGRGGAAKVGMSRSKNVDG